MKKLISVFLGLLLVGQPLFAADKPLVMEAGQVKQLPTATSLQLQAPTTANATVNLPHGTAPTSPTNGDCWTTTAALTCRINGANASLAGANTGDQTITLTGDATGSGTGSFATTLATVNSAPGSFGSATTSLTATVNGKGLITSLSSQTVTPAFSSITGKPTTLSGYGITDAQGLNANLTAISGLTTAADKMIYWTGAGTAALVDQSNGPVEPFRHQYRRPDDYPDRRRHRFGDRLVRFDARHRQRHDRHIRQRHQVSDDHGQRQRAHHLDC
jgi:hypothetical protein